MKKRYPLILPFVLSIPVLLVTASVIVFAVPPLRDLIRAAVKMAVIP